MHVESAPTNIMITIIISTVSCKHLIQELPTITRELRSNIKHDKIQISSEQQAIQTRMPAMQIQPSNKPTVTIKAC